MLEVFVILCLQGQPKVCEEHTAFFNGNELQCNTQAQAIVAKQLYRDNFVIERFGCRRIQ